MIHKDSSDKFIDDVKVIFDSIQQNKLDTALDFICLIRIRLNRLERKILKEMEETK